MNQKEIAKTLSVSIATVSLALRDSPRIKKETKEKINELARLIKYRPNLTAQSLLKGRTFMVGIISSQFFDPFHAELAGEIHRYLKKENYVGIFFPIESSEEYQEAVGTLLSRRVDGLILTISIGAEKLVKLKEEDVPVVFYQEQRIPVDYVDVNIYKGGLLATTHLINLGHKKIGFIDMQGEDEARVKGYKDALYQHNLSIKRKWMIPGPGYQKGGYDGMKKILALKDGPTAIFSHNDRVAIGAMRAIFEAGLKVPEDIAIVGFDDMEESKYLDVPLTTINLPRKEIAKKLVGVILGKIESKNGSQPQKIVIEPKLIIRESCGFYLKRKGCRKRE